MKLFVAGEGEHELGKWVESAENRSSSRRTDGVLAELFRLSHPSAAVLGAIAWRRIVKYRAGKHASNEERNWLGALNQAEESGADVFIWARDTDGDSHRADQLRRASTFAEPSTMQIAGGVADPCLESWMVAIARAHADPDSLTVSKLAKIASENEIDSEEQMVELVKARGQEGNFGSPSLRAWLIRAARVRPRSDENS